MIVFDVQELRQIWKEVLPKIDVNHLVFLDESGINTNMTRSYGRSIGKKRVVEKVPLRRTKRRSIIGAIRVSGTIRYRSFQGSINGKRFLEYLKVTLLPSIKPLDIVIMDNLNVHKVKGVEEMILSVGAIPLYLPAYSPDLNPIELMWSKVKSFLKSWKVREVDLLKNYIKKAISKVNQLDIIHWFNHTGYTTINF